MEVVDYLLDENFDLRIANGDFVKGDATLQHQKKLLLAEKGSYKQSPTIGVAIRNEILNDAEPDELESNIQSEFEKDGMTISKLELHSFEDIQIEASYGG